MTVHSHKRKLETEEPGPELSKRRRLDEEREEGHERKVETAELELELTERTELDQEKLQGHKRKLETKESELEPSKRRKLDQGKVEKNHEPDKLTAEVHEPEKERKDLEATVQRDQNNGKLQAKTQHSSVAINEPHAQLRSLEPAEARHDKETEKVEAERDEDREMSPTDSDTDVMEMDDPARQLRSERDEVRETSQTDSDTDMDDFAKQLRESTEAAATQSSVLTKADHCSDPLPDDQPDSDAEVVGWTGSGRYMKLILWVGPIEDGVITVVSSTKAPPNFDRNNPPKDLAMGSRQERDEFHMAKNLTKQNARLHHIRAVAWAGRRSINVMKPKKSKERMPVTFVQAHWIHEHGGKTNAFIRWDDRTRLRKIFGKADADLWIYQAAQAQRGVLEQENGQKNPRPRQIPNTGVNLRVLFGTGAGGVSQNR